jgi:hypothetical protein
VRGGVRTESTDGMFVLAVQCCVCIHVTAKCMPRACALAVGQSLGWVQRSLHLCWCSYAAVCACLSIVLTEGVCCVMGGPASSCRCALQEASQLQGEVQQLGQQVQDLAQQLLEAQNAKVSCTIRMRTRTRPCLLMYTAAAGASDREALCWAQQHDCA